MSYIGRGIDQIDNISTLDNLSFNGSDATFNLTQNSVAFVPVSADALQIQIDGVIQSGNYTVSGSTVTFDFTPSGSSVCNGIRHFGVGLLTTVSDGAVTSAKLGNNSVGITQLNVSDGTNGQALTTNGSGTLAFDTISGTTINTNADNRVITGSGTANTLNGEANLTFDGTQLSVLDTDAGTDNLLVKTTGDNQISMALEKSDFKFDIGLDHNNDGSKNFYIRERSEDGVLSNAVRMMIESDGTIAIPDSTDTGRILIEGGFNNPQIGIIGPTTTNTTKMYFSNGNGTVGTIATSGTSTSYNTSSDYRLKENEVVISNGIERLKQLKPYRFNFKADTDTTVDGFFAHEVSSIVPEAIQGEKDAVDSDNNPIHQGIDQSKLVPLLTSALQEAITKIETLEARVQALENA